MNWQTAELEQYTCTLYETKDQLKQHIFKRADQAFRDGDAARDRIGGIAELDARRKAMKEALLAAVGGLPPSDTPLNARITKRVQGEGYVVECVVYEARPKHYVTANLYLPDDRKTPGPAVLFLCGHEYEGKHSKYYHEVCLRFVQAGLIVLAVDPIGQGERLSGLTDADGRPVWGTAEHQRLGVQCYAVGQSIARYFIHDAMRAIDFLESRPEVDAAKIGVTGNSGGGTQTAMMMVLDERVAAAAPVTFIMNRQQYMHAGGVQDAEQVWPGLTAQGFDHEDLLLSFAPKPLFVGAVQYDFFPIEATRRTVQRSRRFWDMYGCGDRLQLMEDKSTHRYTDRLAIGAAHFFLIHLAQASEETGQVFLQQAGQSAFPSLDSSQLLCTESGQVMTEYGDARAVKDEWIEDAERLSREMQEGSYPIRWVREQVFAGRKPCPLNPRVLSLGTFAELDVQYAMWWSQEEIVNSAYIFRAPQRGKKADSAAAIAVWPNGTLELSPYQDWIRSMCAEGVTVVVLNLSGVGPHEPHPIYKKPVNRFFGVMHKLADELLWLGDSLAALRAYDIIRCVEFLCEWDEADAREIRLYGAGLFRIYAELAARIDSRIVSVSGLPEDETLPEAIRQWLATGLNDDTHVMSVIFPHLLKACR